MSDDGVRITNRELYDRLERLEDDLRGRLEAMAREEHERWERNSEQLFKLKLGLGVGLLGVMATLAKLFADLGLPTTGVGP